MQIAPPVLRGSGISQRVCTCLIGRQEGAFACKDACLPPFSASAAACDLVQTKKPFTGNLQLNYIPHNMDFGDIEVRVTTFL